MSAAKHTPAVFGFPDTHTNQCAHLSAKTRKLPDGRFEAVAAIYFMGQRGLTVYSVAATRGRALTQAERATESQRNLRNALMSGAASYSQAIPRAAGSPA